MESVLGRYRNLIVLVGVLFAQVLGLAVQVRRTTDNEPTRLIRIWAVGTVTPFERVLVWARTSTNNIWHNYFYLRGVRAENQSQAADRAHESRAGANESGRRPGTASAGFACFQRAVYFADHGGAGHWFERQRAVAVGLHRQGREGRNQIRHG